MKSYFKPIKAYIWKSFHGCSSDEGAAVKWLKDEARQGPFSAETDSRDY